MRLWIADMASFTLLRVLAGGMINDKLPDTNSSILAVEKKPLSMIKV